jgi:O-antigen/teichoic acid export membrane protein
MFVNSVLLFPQLIGAVIYPRIVQNLKKAATLRKILRDSILLALGIQMSLVPILWGLSTFAVQWVAGAGHTDASSAILLLAVAYVPIGTSIVLAQFVMAMSSRKYSILVLCEVVCGAIILHTNSSSISDFLTALIAVSSVIAFSMFYSVKKMIGGISEPQKV